MSDCPHLQFRVDSKVARLTDSHDPEKVLSFMLELEVFCLDCYQPFKFVGFRKGISPEEPMTNFEETEVRIPIKPVTE